MSKDLVHASYIDCDGVRRAYQNNSQRLIRQRPRGYFVICEPHAAIYRMLAG